MKKFPFIILAALVVVGTALGVLAFHPGPVFRAAVNSWGSDIPRTPLRLESAEFSLLSTEATLSGLTVDNPDGYTAGQAISVPRMRVAMPKPINRDCLVFDRVELSDVIIFLETKKGSDNLDILLANADASARDASWPEWLKFLAPRRIAIRELRMTGATVNWVVPMTGGRTLSVPLPDIHLRNVATDGAGFSPAAIFAQVLRQIRREILQMDFSAELSTALQRTLRDLSGFLKNLGRADGHD